MPTIIVNRRMLTACRMPGCPELTRGGLCARHQRAYEMSPQRQRAKHAYPANWPAIKAVVLAAQPFCRCGARSREVDHKVPLSLGGTNDLSNLEGRCKPCHSRKTAGDKARHEDGRWG